MTLKKCNFCKENKVPKKGQCNSCGFIDGLDRQPLDDDFKQARLVNDDNEYDDNGC